MLVIGIAYGMLIGVTAGGVTSGAMGFVAGVAHRHSAKDPDVDFKTLTIGPGEGLLVGGFLGGFNGGWMGCIVGVIVGGYCGRAEPLRPATVMWLSGGMSALGGGFFGYIAGTLVWSVNSPLSGVPVVAGAAGALFAGACGFTAGCFLGRRLYATAVRIRT
jgi:hypothetical protein